jgi:hypothetical protein
MVCVPQWPFRSVAVKPGIGGIDLEGDVTKQGSSLTAPSQE